MLNGDSEKKSFTLSQQGRTSMVLGSLPSALNQDRPANAQDILHYLVFVLLAGLIVYAGTFWSLWLFTRLFARRSYRTIHKAAAVFGVAAAAALPLIYLAHALIPDSIWSVSEVILMIAIVIAAFVLAFRLLRRRDSSSELSPMVHRPK
jgi:uncharacterized membrane protein